MILSIADNRRMPLDTAKIRRLREGRGLSQEEAARIAGVAGRQYWQKLESGRVHNPGLQTIERIAHALGVHPRDLLK